VRRGSTSTFKFQKFQTKSSFDSAINDVRRVDAMKTPLPHGPISEPVEIHLESNDIVLRGLTGEATESAILIGEVVVNLFEQTTLKEIQ
jgi:hypothetical protein